MQKACRADISVAHGVSRGLVASKEIPEAQNVFMKEDVFASGMETDVLSLLILTMFSCLPKSLLQIHAIV